MELPQLPATFDNFISLLESRTKSQQDVREVIEPYKNYENKLRQIYAQHPEHAAIQENHLVPVFAGNEAVTIKARNLVAESEQEKSNFLLALPDDKRRAAGSQATVSSLKDFRTNFNLFSESSLSDLDWSNVVASGSSVLTALLPVDAPHNENKRAHRAYYHEKLAPASDVDLFLYGLNEEEAIEKIRKIERAIRDSILAETTTIRTKNTITIVSEYPIRHVQIVLRLYKSVSEIITGFDVDCACVAYDGKQVWASPRALAALATQTNGIDLTRRSPSYENRLSKYSHRGFEVYWPGLDRDRVDPTIYERSFGRVVGLARLLVLEKLPHPNDRDTFLAKRREERGRPQLPWNARYRHALPGNVKDAQPDDVAEWLDEDEQSSYHTFTVPYGPKYTAAKVEKLLFKKDLLLNAEWNRSKERETTLHRHPAFFGAIEDVIKDCCGFCPQPVSDIDLAAHEVENRLYVSGDLQFINDDPGRQAIGSFNPITDTEWTDMAYVGNTAQLCQAIVDNNLEGVKDWFNGGGDVNHRDHTGRTPLQLAVMTSTTDIVQFLIDHDARITSRIYNGLTALHMAAHRGAPEIVRALLDRSALNEEQESKKEDARKEARRAAASQHTHTTSDADGDIDMNDDGPNAEEEGDEDAESDDFSELDAESDDAMTEGSFVKVDAKAKEQDAEDNPDDPDYYDVNVLAWDAPVSPLHLAIIAGHVEIVTMMIEAYGADVLLPVKLLTNHTPREARATILTLTLACFLPLEKSHQMVETLLHQGASLAQADANGASAFHYLVRNVKEQVLELLQKGHGETVDSLVNHGCMIKESYYSKVICTPLVAAIHRGSLETVKKILALGAEAEITLDTYAKLNDSVDDPDRVRQNYRREVAQPIIQAAERPNMAEVVEVLLDRGCDVNTMNGNGHSLVINDSGNDERAKTVLDCVRRCQKDLTEFIEGKPQDSYSARQTIFEPQPLPQEALGITLSDTYQSWLLQKNLASAKDILAYQNERYQQEQQAKQPDNSTKHAANITKARELLAQQNVLELKLIERGAKTFAELHPKLTVNRASRSGNYYGDIQEGDREPFKNRTSFLLPGLTDATKIAYNELFEAAFHGDIDKVKDLCLSKQENRAPLQVAVQDLAGFSPFSLAVLKGNQQLAMVILDICAAQYKPSKDDEKTFRYTMHRPDDVSEYDSDYNSDEEAEEHDEFRIYKELIKDRFTIDDVRTLSNEVKCKVSPSTMFAWTCEIWRALDNSEATSAKKACGFGKPVDPSYWMYGEVESNPWPWFNNALRQEATRCRGSLLQYAIVKNDMSLLKFWLHTNRELNYKPDDEHDLDTLQISEKEFSLALDHGRTELISEIIKQTGALLPVRHLAQKSGVSIEEKPKYYQGLTVHGKKRSDWAERDRGVVVGKNASDGSPLLTAIRYGNLETVEYFLSDTPLRQYEQFINHHKHDKQIETLIKAEGGIEKALQSWMNTRTHLALHIGVMSKEETCEQVVEYLTRKLPQFIDSKCDSGTTPLHVALQLKRYDVAQLLIKTGAKQTCRTKRGKNAMHTIYTNSDDPKAASSFTKNVSMFMPETVQSLLVQRTQSDADGPGCQTPLATYCAKIGDDDSAETLDAMLELSQGNDLKLMDGAGDYVLHGLLRSHKIQIARHIAKKFPEMLLWENASGMTPIQVAENAFLNRMVAEPPKVVEAIHSYSWNPPVTVETCVSSWKDPTAAPELDIVREFEEMARTASVRRKLVSLLDANEVARRLAEIQRNANQGSKQAEALGLNPNRDYQRFAEEQVKQDEVAQWGGYLGLE